MLKSGTTIHHDMVEDVEVTTIHQPFAKSDSQLPSFFDQRRSARSRRPSKSASLLQQAAAANLKAGHGSSASLSTLYHFINLYYPL
jgi:hypothetical protein